MLLLGLTINPLHTTRAMPKTIYLSICLCSSAVVIGLTHVARRLATPLVCLSFNQAPPNNGFKCLF